MNITELRYLVAIKKWGSVSAAAKQLYAAQPNVSKALKNLEEEYGLRIFERSSTGMIPTEQGRRFIEQAARVLEEVDRLTEDAHHARERCAELRVMIPHATYASYAAVDFLKEAAGADHGISQVKVTGSADVSAAELYAWMAQYTRYDTTFAYSNAIAQRLDYTSARVAAQKQAKAGQVQKTLSDGTQILAQEDVAIDGHGTVQVGVIAFSDNSGDGLWDPREYIAYVPDGFEGKELPVLVLYPGNSQTDSIFMDSTLWWQVADKEGIVLAFVCETYSASPSSVSHADSDKFYNSLMAVLEETIDGTYADLDFTRIYGSGQSAGSNTTQGFAMTNPEFYAAVATTSGAVTPKDPSKNQEGMMVTSTEPAYESIPTMMVTGQMDSGSMADGFEAKDMQSWANYMLQVNGFEVAYEANSASSVVNADSRHPEVYIWSKTVDGVEVPLVQWAQCLLRPHNCYPSDMPMLWDFMEHFSFEKAADGTVTRYYSPSAFEKDDAVALN